VDRVLHNGDTFNYPLHPLTLKATRCWTPLKYPHSTRSYALVRSSFNAPYFLQLLFPWLIACRHSNAISALSVTNLLGIKTLYIGEMISCNKGRSLLTKHLETPLYMTLHKQIGLKSFRYSGSSFLGSKIIIVSFTPSGILPDWKNSFTALTTSSFKISQFYWKKRAGNPSGPDAFKGPIWNKALLISSSEKSLRNASFISFVITGWNNFRI
jgi:hypothetical protein